MSILKFAGSYINGFRCLTLKLEVQSNLVALILTLQELP